MTGKLELIYEVMCAECQHAEHPPGKYKTDAARNLHLWGWKETKRGWICSNCVQASNDKK